MTPQLPVHSGWRVVAAVAESNIENTSSETGARILHGFSSTDEMMYEQEAEGYLPQSYSIVPLFTGGLSLIASSIIVREVIVDHRNQKGNAITRLLMSMSVAGALFALGTLMSTFASPSELDYLYWNIGTTATCDLQGFLLTLGFTASPMFVLALSYFYLLVIRYDYPDMALHKVEGVVHTLIWLVSLTISMVPLVMGMYNNDMETCWITEAPYECTNVDSNIECERGHGASDYAHVLAFIPLWPCMTMCIVAVGCLYWTVLGTEYHSAKYTGNRMAMDGDRAEHFRVEDDEDNVLHSTIDQQLSKAVAMQASLYILSFLVTNGSHLAATLLDLWSGTWHQSSQFFAFVVCIPLQGKQTLNPM